MLGCKLVHIPALRLKRDGRPKRRICGFTKQLASSPRPFAPPKMGSRSRGKVAVGLDTHLGAGRKRNCTREVSAGSASI